MRGAKGLGFFHGLETWFVGRLVASNGSDFSSEILSVLQSCCISIPSRFVLANTAAVVLANFVKEIRNETVWSDQSVCGTAQLACAISLRSLAVSPADHLSEIYVLLPLLRHLSARITTTWEIGCSKALFTLNAAYWGVLLA